MRSLSRDILILMAVLLPAAALAETDGKAAPKSKPPVGSVARQLLLKHQLQSISEGGLAELVSRNRSDWKSLTPDEQDRYRHYALAFLEKNPQEQEKLIARHERLIKMSAQRRQAYRQRAKWLKVVIDSFTPEQRRELEKLSPEDRARRLLQRKAELIKQGKLAADPPPAASQPASAPATQPAEEPPATQPAETKEKD